MLLNLILMLKYRISLYTDDALDSLDTHLKIEGESRLYETNRVAKIQKAFLASQGHEVQDFTLS